MKDSLKMLLFGFLTWLVPFVSAFVFYTREGTLTIDEGLFKSLMVLISGVTGVFLLVLFFKKINAFYLQTGIMIGLVWLAINWLLDFVILIPMSGMDFNEYFTQIGLRYLIIPVMSTGLGYTLSTHTHLPAAAEPKVEPPTPKASMART